LIDHGTRREGGLSPQGYLAVIGEKLVVPSGRALPGFLDPKSGKMDPYTTAWGGRAALAKGCWHVSGIGDYLFQSGDVYGMTPGAGATAGDDETGKLLTPEEFAKLAHVSLATVEQWLERKLLVTVEQEGKLLINPKTRGTITYLSWWTGTPRPGEQHALEAHPRLQIDPANNSELGVFREAVLTEGTIYYSRPVNNVRGRGGYWPAKLSYEQIVAYDIANPKRAVNCTSGWSGKRVVWDTVAFEQLWSLQSDLKVHIKAGSRLYGGAPGVVAAVDIPAPGGEPKVSWQAEIEGTPFRLLASDGKLFVRSGDKLFVYGIRSR